MIKWSVIVFSIFLTACSKEIEIDQENIKSLVLNSIFNPADHFTFRVSTTASLSGNYDSLNENIHLSLYESERLVIDSIIQSGVLETNLRALPGIKYTIELSSDNYPLVKAYDTIPALVPIDDAYMIFPAGVDAFGFYLAEANISFTDPENEANYYELLISTGPGGTNVWQTGYQTNDRLLLNEGDQDYHPSTFFFSDELINGEPYTIRIKGGIGYSRNNNVLKPFPLYATLRSVSRVYYKYRKYYTRHRYNQQFQNEFPDLIFKGEPQNMYTNVENGFGIFAGYCETTQQIIYNE